MSHMYRIIIKHHNSENNLKILISPLVFKINYRQNFISTSHNLLFQKVDIIIFQVPIYIATIIKL